MPHESYRAPISYSIHLASGKAPFTMPQRVLSKLHFYASASEAPMKALTAQDAVINLIESEGKDPANYKALLEAMEDYTVVYPNMFLTERVDGNNTVTEFNPKGEAAQRLKALAGSVAIAIRESAHPAYAWVDKDKVQDYVYDYIQSFLADPFASIADLSAYKPVLILNDMSYTSAQLFRAFSGVYCDYTPVLPLSKADFLEFSVFHEIAHKRTETILQSGKQNQFLPGIELGMDPDAMAHKNLVESIADAYGVLKHIQRSGSGTLPMQIATMRTLSAFAAPSQPFETKFTLAFGNTPRKRTTSEYYTAPSIDAAIAQGLELFQNGTLQHMDEQELTELAISISQCNRLPSSALHDLSLLATSIHFNALRTVPHQDFPRHKESISPAIITLALNEVEKQGRFMPKGGASLENAFLNPSTDTRLGIDEPLKQVFERYRRAVQELHDTELPPFSEALHGYLKQDLVSTLALKANQTPNMTLARELNDAFASEHKYCALSEHFDLVGVRNILGNAYRERCFPMAREYRQASDRIDSYADILINAAHAIANVPKKHL